MLPTNKIFIDSRFKSSDSASHSDFKIDLPLNFLMPEDTGFYIDDVCIPHSWYPIEAGRNTQLVVTYDIVVHVVAVAIDSGNYSVKGVGVAIVAEINKKGAMVQNGSVGKQYSESKFIINTSEI